MAKITELLNECVKRGGSDLHLAVGVPPQIRVDGKLKALEGNGPLGADDTKALCFELLSSEQQKRFIGTRELDFSFSLGKTSRIRANIFWQQGTIAAAFRSIPFQIPSPKELGVPEKVMTLTEKPRGLVLVTGPTGSGKSTTLAAMIDRINKTRNEHIITVEDPIEYIYVPNKCLINQREIGNDTENFANALKYILRQDPDVVLIGEMRDLETIRNAITIAETGHLVLATLHTNNAAQTVDRIIDVFPPHQQQQVRIQLSFILEGIVSQQLIPRIGGGRCLAMEIMFPTSAIRNLIRDNKTHQIYAAMQVGQEETKIVTMNQSLASLVLSNTISYEDGLHRSTDTYEFISLTEKKGGTAPKQK